MNIQVEHFLENVKELFASERFSDGTLYVIEKEDALSSVSSNNQVKIEDHDYTLPSTSSAVEGSKPDVSDQIISENSQTENIYCSFPIHFFILASQSEFFDAMLSNPSTLESQSKEIRLKVKRGDGCFLKLLIKSFYHQNLLRELPMFTLYKIVILADRYSCSAIIKQIENHLSQPNIRNVNECSDIVENICAFEDYMLTSKIIEKFFNLCISYCLRRLCPFEYFALYSNRSLGISYELLFTLLKSRNSLAQHENTVLYFVSIWLNYNVSRQQENIIEKLLNQINYRRLTAEFLSDIITEQHPIFNVWSNYKQWYINAITYHAFSPKRPCYGENFGDFPANFDRNFSYKHNIIVLNFEMRRANETELLPESSNQVYQGYRISPTLRFRECNQSPNHYVLLLNIKVDNLKNDLRNSLPDDQEVLNFSPKLVISDSKHFLNWVENDDFYENHARQLFIRYTLESNEQWLFVGYIEKQCFNVWRKIVTTLFFLPQNPSSQFSYWHYQLQEKLMKLKSLPFNIRNISNERQNTT